MKKSSNQDSFIEKVKKTIDSNHLLDDSKDVLIGVSGGPDSMCLLHVFLNLAAQRGYRLEIAHVDHALRGESSRSDQDFVAQYCERNRLVFHTATIDVRQFAREHSLGIEEAARIVRYRFFEECAAGRNMRIAVAHHQQDQVETILLNLIRGCGLDGLKGMDHVSGDIIRPFLDCRKEEIDAYLSAHEIPYCIDLTNEEACADRNRVRLELLPAFQRLFGRNVSLSVIKTQNLCLQDADYLDEQSLKHFLALASGDSLPCGALCELHPAMMSRVIRNLYEKAKGDKKNLSFKQTESILRIAKKKRNGTSVDLSDGYCAVISEDRLFIRKQEEIHEGQRLKAEVKDRNTRISIPLVIPAKRCEPVIGATITTRFIENPEKILVENPGEVDYNAMTWYFPYETAKGSVWRFRKEGDWIRPNRSSGRKTLQKYLIDRKVPADRRDRLLLLAKGSEILWIPEIITRHRRKPLFTKQDMLSPVTGECMEFISVEVEYRS